MRCVVPGAKCEVQRNLRALVAQAFRPAIWLALCVAPLIAQSQSTELHVKFKSGQGVVPVYEGWERVGRWRGGGG
jgi:hypothetical protein